MGLLREQNELFFCDAKRRVGSHKMEMKHDFFRRNTFFAAPANLRRFRPNSTIQGIFSIGVA